LNNKHKFQFLNILLFFLLSFNLSGQQDFSLVSWNIRDFGKTKDAEEINTIAKTVREYDIVAIQEVVAGYGGAQAVARLADKLNRMGSKWDYRISDPTESPPYKTERYAFLWKTSKVQLVGRPWLDKDNKDLIFREPYLAKFKVKGKQFIIANYHSRRFDEKPEEEVVAFYDYPDKYPGIPVIIAGDFNMAASEKVFKQLYKNGFSANLMGIKTTLKRKCSNSGYYRNYSIDFILYQNKYFVDMDSGAIDFVGDCDNLEKARGVSDHLPVWTRFECL
jgi:deoxyribonuclease-1-like protein